MKNFYFDLDGVLIDACEWHYQAFNIALYKNNENTLNRIQHNQKYNGLPTRTKLKLLNIPPDKHQAIINEKNRIMNNIINAQVKPNQNLINFLKHVKTNSKLAVVTNSIPDFAHNILVKLRIFHLFDTIVTNQDVKNNKPHPDPYNFAINKLKADNDYNIAVEDSPVGIQAAANSNINMIWKIKNPTELTIENYNSIFHSQHQNHD